MDDWGCGARRLCAVRRGPRRGRGERSSPSGRDQRPLPGADDPGPAEVAVERLREGRTASTLRAVLLQDGVQKIVAHVTVATLEDQAPVYQVTLTRCCPPPPSASRARPACPTGARCGSWNRSTCASIPARSGGPHEELSGVPEVRGWIRARDDTPPDAAFLVFCVDALPPTRARARGSGLVADRPAVDVRPGAARPGLAGGHRAGVGRGRWVVRRGIRGLGQPADAWWPRPARSGATAWLTDGRAPSTRGPTRQTGGRRPTRSPATAPVAGPEPRVAGHRVAGSTRRGSLFRTAEHSGGPRTCGGSPSRDHRATGLSGAAAHVSGRPGHDPATIANRGGTPRTRPARPRPRTDAHSMSRRR